MNRVRWRGGVAWLASDSGPTSLPLTRTSLVRLLLPTNTLARVLSQPVILVTLEKAVPSFAKCQLKACNKSVTSKLWLKMTINSRSV